MESIQCLFNIKGPLTKGVKDIVVGGMEDQPTFVLAQQSLAHACAEGAT